MEWVSEIVSVVLHLDTHLVAWAEVLGIWLYVLLFVIIFCETGLVVTPFLPGDSLLFATGALISLPGSPIGLTETLVLLSVAGVLGDALNYSIGYRLGPMVFTRDTWLLNKEHLIRTQQFYEKHGGKTIVFARFMPIIRTFAPFVAGIGRMRYTRFAVFNVSGGVAWVFSFILAGYLFGGMPVVKDNFHIVILAIIVLSCIPPVVEYLRARAETRAVGIAGK
jgi:membrane-associated protein